MLSAQPDRPIAGPQEDRLGLQPFTDGLATALLADDGRTARGVVLGLEGSWGSGKSSILNLVAARLGERAGARLVLVRFDPWLVSGRDDLIAAFFRELVNAIDPVRKERSRVGSAAAKLAEYGEMLSPALNLYLPFLGTAVGGAIKAAGKGVTPARGPTEMRKDVEKVLRELDRPVVVMVDELDRVEDAEVRTVAQLVRAVLDFPKVSYLLAYDPKRVSEALGGGNAERGAAYLEKIIQLRVPLPAQAPAALRRVLDEDFRTLMATSPAVDRPPEWDNLPRLLRVAVPSLIATLRDARRSLATFAALEPVLRHEVEPVDLLGWSMLVAKAPRFVHGLAEDLLSACGGALLTGEPLLAWYLKNSNDISWINEKLPSPTTKGAAALKEFLFERKDAEPGVQRLGSPLHDSLGWRDTLLTVLTHGGHAPRAPIATTLTAVEGGYDTLRDAAAAAWKRDALPQFLASLRAASWRERTHGPMDLRRWIIDLVEDDAAFDPPSGFRRRHRWLAMGYVVAMHSDQTPATNLDIQALLEAAEEGRVMLASHLVALLVGKKVALRGDMSVAICAFEAGQIKQLAGTLVAWATQRVREGRLARLLRDAEQVEALRLTGSVDASLRAGIWTEVADDAALDRLVQLFFGDEPEHDSPARFGHLFEHSAAIRDRLLARAQAYGEAGPPEELRRAIDAMETRARLLGDVTPPDGGTERQAAP